MLREIFLSSLTGYCSFGDRAVKNLKLERGLPCVSLVLMSMRGVHCDRFISLGGAILSEEIGQTVQLHSMCTEWSMNSAVSAFSGLAEIHDMRKVGGFSGV